MAHFVQRPGSAWRPRKLFQQAENHAVNIRKLLSNARARDSSRILRPTDDAVRLAALVELLAREGRKATGAKAIELAEYVEHLLDLLRVKIDELLSS